VRILKRDCYQCQPCKREDRLTPGHIVDHKTPKFEGGTDDEANLQAICQACHKAKTDAESLRARGLEGASTPGHPLNVASTPRR
jgi:5-methylcytosine-specific restriction protein A